MFSFLLHKIWSLDPKGPHANGASCILSYVLPDHGPVNVKSKQVIRSLCLLDIGFLGA